MNSRAITAAILLSGAFIFAHGTSAHAHFNLNSSHALFESSGQQSPEPSPSEPVIWRNEAPEEKERRSSPKHQSPWDLDFVQDCVPWGLLVVDECAEIVFANERARNFLDARCGIENRGGRLHIQRSYVNRGLLNLIRTAACQESKEISPELYRHTIGVPDQNGHIRYAIQVSPARTNLPTSLVLLMVSDLRGQSSAERSTIASIFNLSEREAELAEFFSCGLRVDEIAQRMGVSTNTVRVHLRHVFSKTGCSSQIQLARTFARVP